MNETTLVTIEQVKELLENREDGMVSARDLHDMLGVETRFNDWMNRMLKYGFEEGFDYTVLKKEYGQSRNNKGQFTSTEYTITRDMAKELCMLARSIAGSLTRKYFIEVEKLATKQQRTQALDNTMERMEMQLLRSSQRRKNLEAENKDLETKLSQLESENEVLDRQNDKLIEALAKKSNAFKPWYYGG